MRGADVAAFRQRRGYSVLQLADVTGLEPEYLAGLEADPAGELSGEVEQCLTMAGAFDGEAATFASELSPPVPSTASLAPTFELDRSQYRYLISNSEVQDFKRCRRRWWLRWFRGLGPKVESPIGVRRVGDRVHRALRAFYDPHPTNLVEELERQIALDRARLTPEQLADDALMKAFGQEADLERIIVEGYLQWLEETGADAELEPLGSEVYVQVPAPWDRDLGLIGRLDARVRRRSDNAVVFLDHKIVGNLTSPVVQLSQDQQMLHYHLIQHTALLGQATVGAVYNMLRRVKRTTRAKPPFYARHDVRHNRHELESYAAQLQWAIRELERLRAELGDGLRPVAHAAQIAYPSPRPSCAWDCLFVAVCPMFDDGSAAEAMLVAAYAPIDPLARYVLDGEAQTEEVST